MDARNFNFDPNDPSAKYLYSLFYKMKANPDMPIIDGFRNPYFIQNNIANLRFRQMNDNNNFQQMNNFINNNNRINMNANNLNNNNNINNINNNFLNNNLR